MLNPDGSSTRSAESMALRVRTVMAFQETKRRRSRSVATP